MTTILLAAAALGQSSAKISDCWQTNFNDASFTAVVGTSNQKELAKINKDFANSYRFKSTTVRLKEPFKLRLETKVDDMDILFIVNGVTRVVRIPSRGIRNKENLAKSPGKRQTSLDFGLLTPALFNNLFEAKFIRTDRATGDHVFDLTYIPALDDTTRHRIWVDPKQRYVNKREWYSQNGGHLLATFLYSEAKQFGTIWFPTKLTVKNADNKVAGSTTYSGVKVNSGVADSTFNVN